MADLGTLWFGADIDLSRLQQKIQQGNQGILDALKMNYDPQSYQQMVDKLRQELGRETFEIKISTNTSSIVNNLKNATKNSAIGSQGLAGINDINEKIYAQRAIVNALRADVARLNVEWKKNGGSAHKKAFLDAQAELAKEKSTLDNLVAQRKFYNEAMRKTEKAKKDSAKASRELEQANLKMNASLGHGLSISTRLGSAISSLFAVSAAKEFLSNVVEIGGQLEKQRISMGAIIGDTARANDLFESIKSLAIKSPFGVVELDQYSKQLAAFGIEQSELFDMTRRLADISAGAGQDIGRLALALGHVKSATYLTGITLRQFSMNNIPMLKMLADYYSEVEKRAVSTAEVQKRISKRQVSYEDVIEQIKRMTDEGGMFYNMQEKISDSVSAKWKNLRDSIDIMYGDIAESKMGDMLKGTAEALMAVTTRWKTFISILASAAAIMGVTKAASLAMNRGFAVMQLRFGIINQISRKTTAEQINMLRVTGQLTKQQLLQAVAAHRLSVEQAKLAASAYRVSESQLQQIATSGKVNAGLYQNAIATSRYSVAQLRLLANMRATNPVFTMFGKRLSFVNGWMLRSAIAVRGLGNALTSLWKGFVGALPQIGFYAAIASVIALWQKNNEEVERAKELNDQLFNRMAEGLRNIHQMMSDTQMTFNVGGKNVDVENFGKVYGTVNAPWAFEVDSSTMQKNIEIWEKFIKEYSAAPNVMLNAAYATDENGKSVKSLAEQYDTLREKVQLVMQSVAMMGKVGEAMNDAIKEANGGWIDDDLLTDLKDYDNAYRKHIKLINATISAQKEQVSTALDAARSNATFAKALEENNIPIDNLNKQIEFLAANQKKYEDAVKSFEDSWAGSTGERTFGAFLTGSLEGAFDELEEEFGQVAENMREQLNIENLTPKDRESLGLALTQQFADAAIKAGVTADEVKRRWMELCKTKFPEIVIDVNIVEQRIKISELKEDINKLIGEDFLINIDGATNIFEVVKKIREEYAKAKEDIENGEPILIKFHLSADQVSVLTDEQIKQLANGDEVTKQMLEGIRERQKVVRQAMSFFKSTGISPTDPTKDKNKNKNKSTGSKSDPWLKSMREREKELENFYKIYTRYAEYLQKDEAMEKALNTDALKGKDLPRNIDDYLSVLKDFRKKVEAEIGAKPSEERKTFLTDLITKIDEKEFELKFKEEFDKAVKEMQEYADRELSKYDLYKSLFEKTNNRDFAKAAFSDSRIWDDAARGLEEKLMEVSGEITIDYTMSDEAAKEHFKGVAGGYDLWKRIVDLTRNNYTEALEKAADAMSSMKSLQQKIADNESKINELRNKNDGINHSAEIEELESEIVRWKGELLSISPEFKALFVETTDMSIRQIKALYEHTKAWKDLVDRYKTKDVRNQNGELIGYEYINAEGKPDFIPIDEYKRLEKQLDKLRKKVPELSISFKRLWNWISGKDADNDGKADLTFRDIAQDLANVMDAARGTTEALGAMFDTLGNEDIADGFALAGDLLGAGGDIAKGIATGDPLAVINGIANGISAIAEYHDKKLDKAIQKSQREVKRLQNAYKNLQWQIGNQLSVITKEQSIEMIRNLEQQERELEGQLANEKKKKKDDPDKIIDLEQQIEEAKQQLSTFYKELGEQRYGLDLDSWASDLTSAIVDAFAAGEDAAEAFDKKVADIMKSVVSNIIKIQVVKPAMDSLSNFLFGSNGIATTNSVGGVEITPREASQLVDKLLELKSTVESGKNVYDVVAEALKSMGIEWGEDSSSSKSGTSNTIKSITEDTADLLASYINAIRADVSMNRLVLEESLPAITVAVQRTNVIAEQQVAYQEQIAANTRANAEAAASIYDILHRVEIGAATLSVK